MGKGEEVIISFLFVCYYDRDRASAQRRNQCSTAAAAAAAAATGV